MRSFAAFLDRKTVLWGSAPFESDRIRFNTMWMHLDAHITSDDVRAFAANWTSMSGPLPRSPQRCDSRPRCSLSTSGSPRRTRRNDGCIPLLVQHGSALVLGNLLSLVPVFAVVLQYEYSRLTSPPGLVASLLVGLPSSGRTLKSLYVQLPTFDASTSQALRARHPKPLLGRPFVESAPTPGHRFGEHVRRPASGTERRTFPDPDAVCVRLRFHDDRL